MSDPAPGWATAFEAELRQLLNSSPDSGGEGGPHPGEPLGDAGTFLSSLPAGYRERTSPRVAAGDWVEISRWLGPGRRHGEAAEASFVLTAAGDRAPGDFRLRRTGPDRMELSSFLPVLESFGLAVVESVPWHLLLGPERVAMHLDDIGLRVSTKLIGRHFDLARSKERLVDAVQAVLRGDTGTNQLNRLVVGAGLTWREVNVLCTYVAYREVVGGPRATERAEAMVGALVEFPAAALALARLFSALLVPGSEWGPEEARSAVTAGLGDVPDLARYEALGELVAMVEGTNRSNWGLFRGPVTIKLASGSVPFLPSPRPVAEAFVWSPWFEGLHLRFGLVARGGMRWSDRQSDLRAEVLGLARAQVKKNSVIVPTGAKGGFVLRQEPGDRAQAEAAYRAFVGGLLDITDNIVGGRVVHPEGVVCRDGPDPYLVVAPDKGTATFSDLANAISTDRGFWLGDAFASGGSRGYDHKALGITARGAWVAVRRHFRALGMDPQSDALRVVGVGDMSGDVFGNGMLQSRAIRLIAAFDHRHVFVDPDPDPERSFEERARLSRLDRCSWGDYNLGMASPGAAVFSRQDKQVELSPQAREALGLGRGVGPMTAHELVKAVLRAPVDLIFFGGIGTFVKAPREDDAGVDDRANDEVRVGADQLRARVVAEGANLAVTQRARASYSRRGGRVNGDFVDNAAGVTMSDREVNLKILLGLAEAAGRLTPDDRDKVLVAAQDDVAADVLGVVQRSVVALDGAAASSASELSAYEVLMQDLEGAGLLNRAVEALPEPEELARRRQAGAGLSRPELAVLLAYARSEVARAVEGSGLVTDPALFPCARRYFPPPVLGAFADLVGAHPLFAQLLSSELANEVVDRMGALWAHELAAESGRALSDVAGAYWAAREVLGSGPLCDEVDAQAWSLAAEAEEELRAVVSGSVDRLARWYLAEPGPLDAGGLVGRDRPLADRIHQQVPSAKPANTAGPGTAGPETAGPETAGPETAGPGTAAGAVAARLSGLGVGAEMAEKAAERGVLAGIGELAYVARGTGRDVREVLTAQLVIVPALGLAPLLEVVEHRSAADRWERWQAHLLAHDLVRIRAEACKKALGSHPGAEAGEAARRWLADSSELLARSSALVGELRGARVATTGGASLALCAVAARALADAVGAPAR